MNEAISDITTPDGLMTTHTFHPASSGPSPVVIVYMDGLGVRGALVDIARRIAQNGYYVALPNLFYRSGPFAPFDGESVFSNPAERERIMGLIKEVTPPRVMSDTGALLGWLNRDSAANDKQIATVGYCMGGGPSLRAAGGFPGQVVAAASYHGGHLATDAPDSPHVLAARARGRLYIGYAENDRSFPEAQRQQLDTALTDAGVSYSMELYKAAHGFAMSDLPSFDQAASERHWDTMLSLFRESFN